MRSLRVRLRLTTGISSSSESEMLTIDLVAERLRVVPLLVDDLSLSVSLMRDGLASREGLVWRDEMASSNVTEELDDESLEGALRNCSRVRMRSGVASTPRSLARSMARVSDGYWFSPVRLHTSLLRRARGSDVVSGPLIMASGAESATCAKYAC